MISRRRFLQSSLSLALLPLLPRMAVSGSLRVRPSWPAFCASPSFTSFCNAVAAMRANKNSADPNGWMYWSETHKQFCPHGTKYFLAWHRGFLHRFEAKLRAISGDPNLVLPYWNYYDNPAIPAEFQDPSLPLYRSDRTGTDVTNALAMDAFADTIINFPRGATNAFEPLLEVRPHNRVHNLIGGAMSSVLTSPRDPLFWVHHANIDRLWVAWLAAGNGRHQPDDTKPYWTGDFQYGAGVKSMPRLWTSSTDTYLDYTYDNPLMPTAATTTLATTAASLEQALPLRPASLVEAPLGTSRPLTLDERSSSVDVPLGTQDANRVRALMLAPTGQTVAGQGGSIRVVLDGVRLTPLGERGGFVYDVYLNLPERPGGAGSAQRYLLGSLGAFEITSAQMKAAMGHGGTHGMAMQGSAAEVRLVFPVTDALRRIAPVNLDRLTVSFVRVDGARHPARGATIKIRGFSVQADPGP